MKNAQIVRAYDLWMVTAHETGRLCSAAEDRLQLGSLADRQSLPVQLDSHEHRTPKQQTDEQHGV